MLTVRPARPEDAGWIHLLLEERWGGQVQAVNGETYRPADLPGFVAEADGERVGYAALRMIGTDAWIGLIEALHFRRGIGEALVATLAEAARSEGCRSLRAVTTNDNTTAQAFYRALGFRLLEVRPGAVDRSREVKPSIPLLGDDGTPMTDELEFELPL